MRRLSLVALALLTAIVVGGCILTTGTIVIVENFDTIVSTHDVVNKFHVDLTSNKDYNDNKDKIKSIDSIRLAGWVINHGTAPNSGELWLSHDGSLTIPGSTNATLIYRSPTVAAGDSLMINWADATSQIQNYSVLKSEIQNGGNFWVYGVAENVPFDVEFRMGLIITVTVGI